MKRVMNAGSVARLLGCVLTVVCAAQPALAQKSGIPGPNGVGGVPTTSIALPIQGDAPQKATASAAVPAVPAGKRLDATGRPLGFSGQTPEPATGKMGLEGLQVHGHWTIDVRNPDGTLAQHRDFENSLNFSGGALLIGLLSGQLSAGDFMIALGPSGNGACVGATYQWCAIVRSTATDPALFYCPTEYTCNTGLTTTANYGTAPLTGPYSFTLAGSITANQTGAIGSVYTIMNTCGASGYTVTSQNPSQPTTVLPTACLTTTTANALTAPLTNTNITAVPVTNGQLIQVQVVISFS